MEGSVIIVRNKTVKNKWYRNEKGAIDLASIMVGVIVIGLIGGVIAATVFAVIPWAQDNAAKQQLDSIVSAQSSYKGLSSSVPPATPEGLPANSYADSEALSLAGLLQPGDNYCAALTKTGEGYKAVAKSSSGTFWQVTENSKPKEISEWALPSNCAHLADITPTPTLTVMTYECDITSEVNLPLRNSKGVATWSDGTTSTHNGSELIAKTLEAGKTYTVQFDGTYPSISYQNLSGADCLRSVDYWGQETGVTDANFAFENATNLVDVPDKLPSSITVTGNMFHFATSFNDPDISEWDMSNVTRTNRMFRHAEIFNQPLNNWNTSNVIFASGMFDSAYKFNQPLNNWDVSNIWAMNGMFRDSIEFNQSLNEWNTAKVSNTEDMFKNAAKINQPFDNWNTSKITVMRGMFENAESMQADLSNWNTTSLTDGSRFIPKTFPTEYLPTGTTKQI